MSDFWHINPKYAKKKMRRRIVEFGALYILAFFAFSIARPHYADAYVSGSIAFGFLLALWLITSYHVFLIEVDSARNVLVVRKFNLFRDDKVVFEDLSKITSSYKLERRGKYSQRRETLTIFRDGESIVRIGDTQHGWNAAQLMEMHQRISSINCKS